MNPSNLTNEDMIRLSLRAALIHQAVSEVIGVTSADLAEKSLREALRRIGRTLRWLKTRNTSTKDAKQA